MYRNYLKYGLDWVLALLMLLLLSPILIIVGLFCLINFGGKVFFTQTRIGKNEQLFVIYKFITMRPDRDNKLSDSERLTKAGIFLRKYSLDELPQLINILKGDMSWIGPRPLFEKYLPAYKPSERVRHQVRPGITGLAQINGRNNLSWDERLKLDITYVQTVSFSLDVKILNKTIELFFNPANVVVDPRLIMQDLDVERAKQISTPTFTLRKPTVEDVPALLIVKNNPLAASKLTDATKQYSTEDIEKWIQFHNNNINNNIQVIIAGDDNRIIGHVGFYDINNENKSAIFGILIGLPEYWGSGIGTAVTQQFINYGFYQLQLNEIQLTVLESNEPAIKIYQKLGFTIITNNNPGGIIKNGRTESILTMQLLKS